MDKDYVSPFQGKEIKTDFSYVDIILMIKILNTNEKRTYRSKLAKQIGRSSANLHKVFNYLKKQKIIKTTEKIGRTQMIEINFYLLKHFIDEQDELNWLEDNYLRKYNKYEYKEYTKK